MNKERWDLDLDNPHVRYLTIPHILLRRQSALNLTSTELILLLNFLRFWEQDDPTFPNLITLSEETGIPLPRVKTSLIHLETLKYLTLIRKDNLLCFNLNGLVTRLKEVIAQPNKR